jgi:hypothetical protein
MKRKSIFAAIRDMIETAIRDWLRRRASNRASRDLQAETDEEVARRTGQLIQSGERIGRSSGNMKLRYIQAKTQAAAQLRKLREVENRVPQEQRMTNAEYRTALSMYSAAATLEKDAFNAISQAEGMQEALRFQVRVFDMKRQQGELQRELSVSKEDFSNARAQMYKDMMAAMGVMTEGASVDWTSELENRAAEAEGGADMLEKMYGDLTTARGQQLEQEASAPVSDEEMDALRSAYGGTLPDWATKKADDTEKSESAAV